MDGLLEELDADGLVVSSFTHNIAVNELVVIFGVAELDVQVVTTQHFKASDGL